MKLNERSNSAQEREALYLYPIESVSIMLFHGKKAVCQKLIIVNTEIRKKNHFCHRKLSGKNTKSL